MTVHLLSVLMLAGVTASTDTPPDALARWLWEVWPARRVVDQPPPCLRPAELDAALAELVARHGDRLRVEEVGRSVEGRPLRLLTLGAGPERILLFSQMHGDEPSATPALLDVIELLLDGPDRPELERVLERFTLLVLPMLNPDGAEVYQRRNAQGIDINRDALNLATPEGRTLKAVRDRHRPLLAFNLHDQDRRTAVANTGRLSTISVLAVAGDEAQTVTPGRRRAMRASSAIVAALQPYVPGGIARYDEDWNPRAFGDNLTAWGTPVVLLESGGLPPGRDLSELARLNFVAVLAVLAGLAQDDLAGHDAAIYQKLPRTASGGWADVVLRGARLLQPPSSEPYRADLAFDQPRPDRAAAGCALAAGNGQGARLVEVGDARFIGAGREVDASERLVVPALLAAANGWRARRWLDATGLERLARHGVATVQWRVPAARLAAALEVARRHAGPGRARLVPTVEPPDAAEVRLSGPPPEPAAGVTFGELITRLDPTAAAYDPAARRAMALRPGADASFLVLRPEDASAARPDPGAARLDAAWIGGVEHVATRSDA